MSGKTALITGITTRARDFVEWAFADAGIAIEWRGEGIEADLEIMQTSPVMREA